MERTAKIEHLLGTNSAAVENLHKMVGEMVSGSAPRVPLPGVISISGGDDVETILGERMDRFEWKVQREFKVQQENRETERQEAAHAASGPPTRAAHILGGGRDASSPALWLDVAPMCRNASALAAALGVWDKEGQRVQWSRHSRSWSVGHSRERERTGERTLGSAKGRPREYSPRYPPSPRNRMSNNIDKNRALVEQQHFNRIDWSNRRGSTPRNSCEASPRIQWEEGSAMRRSTADQSMGDTRWSNGSNSRREANRTPEGRNGENEGERGRSADPDDAPAGMRREGSNPRTISSAPMTPGR
jgi:hypothetical protein